MRNAVSKAHRAFSLGMNNKFVFGPLIFFVLVLVLVLVIVLVLDSRISLPLTPRAAG